MKFRIIQGKAGRITGAVLVCGILLLFILTAWAQIQVNRHGREIYSDMEKVPPREFALVPGTARIVQGKFPNPYFRNRIDAAVQLYRAGKVKKILVSGDNSRQSYNEPEDMKNALLECGVRETDILQDFAGFRTLDSIVRARNVFHISDSIFVSQEFHCRRAIYLAKKHGMPEMIGFAAADVPLRFRIKRFFREPLACLKAFLDVNILKTKPHFEK